MALALLAEFMGCCTVARFIGNTGPVKAAAAFLSFFARDCEGFVSGLIATEFQGQYLRPRKRSYSTSSASVAPPWCGESAIGGCVVLVGILIVGLLIVFTRAMRCEPCGLIWFIRKEAIFMSIPLILAVSKEVDTSIEKTWL